MGRDGALDSGCREQGLERSGREPPIERGNAIGDGVTIKSEQRPGEAPPERGQSRAPQVSDDDTDPGNPIALTEQVNNRLRREVVEELAHQDEVDAPGPKRKGGGVADERGEPALPRQSRGGWVPFQADRAQLDSPPGGPIDGHEWKVTRSRPDVEQGQRSLRVERHASQRATQPEPNRVTTTEPPIGTRDVAERLSHGSGFGSRIIEKFDPGSRLEWVHGNPAVMYPPR